MKPHIESERQFNGETVSGPLIELLNRDFGTRRWSPGAREKARITELLELFRKLSRRNVNGKFEWQNSDSEFPKLTADLNTRLDRYKTSLKVYPAISATSRGRFFALRQIPNAHSPRSYGECECAFALAQLTEMGLVESLRTCEGDHDRPRWYFARFSNQRFCGVECRIRENASSDKAREARRKCALRYYWKNKGATNGWSKERVQREIRLRLKGRER
jgi:hypothetical protein